MNKLLLISTIFFCCSCMQAQDKPVKNSAKNECYKVMFYNLENLFDTIDDPRTNDNEFLPTSKKHWTKWRYNRKLNNIYKVIISVGDEPPAIVGMSEVENGLVLNNLIQFTPLNKFNYKFIHKDCQDPRGIDVALLYRPDLFKPLNKEFIKITFPFAANKRTRDVLYVKGIIESDTIHVFVNHFPSRARGAASSAESRNYVAKIVRHKVDSLFAVSEKSKIIIMGDFNDEPDDESMNKYLEGNKITSPVQNKKLYNLSYKWLENIVNIGTIKYRGKWNVFDQLIVSGNTINSKSGLYISNSIASIYDADFLFRKGKGKSGKSPFQTYSGQKYLGGFSDHLPVYLDLGKH